MAGRQAETFALLQWPWACRFGMVGLAYASVPLYKLFCQVTGFGGTTQRADAAPSEVRDRDGFRDASMPIPRPAWAGASMPEQPSMTVKHRRAEHGPLPRRQHIGPVR